LTGCHRIGSTVAAGMNTRSRSGGRSVSQTGLGCRTSSVWPMWREMLTRRQTAAAARACSSSSRSRSRSQYQHHRRPALIPRSHLALGCHSDLAQRGRQNEAAHYMSALKTPGLGNISLRLCRHKPGQGTKNGNRQSPHK
jgi:hypothetical protein